MSIAADVPELQDIYAEAEQFKGISLHHLGRLAEALRIKEDVLLRYQKLNEVFERGKGPVGSGSNLPRQRKLPGCPQCL